MSSATVLQGVTPAWLLDRLGPARRWPDALSKFLDAAMLQRLRALWPQLTGARFFVVRHRILLSLLTLRPPLQDDVLAEARALVLTALSEAGPDARLVQVSVGMVCQMMPTLIPDASTCAALGVELGDVWSPASAPGGPLALPAHELLLQRGGSHSGGAGDSSMTDSIASGSGSGSGIGGGLAGLLRGAYEAVELTAAEAGASAWAKVQAEAAAAASRAQPPRKLLLSELPLMCRLVEPGPYVVSALCYAPAAGPDGEGIARAGIAIPTTPPAAADMAARYAADGAAAGVPALPSVTPVGANFRLTAPAASGVRARVGLMRSATTAIARSLLLTADSPPDEVDAVSAAFNDCVARVVTALHGAEGSGAGAGAGAGVAQRQMSSGLLAMVPKGAGGTSSSTSGGGGGVSYKRKREAVAVMGESEWAEGVEASATAAAATAAAAARAAKKPTPATGVSTYAAAVTAAAAAATTAATSSSALASTAGAEADASTAAAAPAATTTAAAAASAADGAAVVSQAPEEDAAAAAAAAARATAEASAENNALLRKQLENAPLLQPGEEEVIRLYAEKDWAGAGAAAAATGRTYPGFSYSPGAPPATFGKLVFALRPVEVKGVPMVAYVELDFTVDGKWRTMARKKK